MVDDDLIERLWAKRTEDKKMTREEIARALRPRVGRSWNLLRMNLWLFLCAPLATLVLQGVNLYGYRTNTTMSVIHALVGTAALCSVGFGIYLSGEIGRLDRMDASLADTIHRRLAFFRGKYEAWMWVCSATLVMLSWAIATMVDNMGGTYPINRPVVFYGTLTVMLLGMYAVIKTSHLPVLREWRAVLEDLEAQVMDRTEEVEAFKRRWRGWALIAIVIATLFLVLGIWLAIHGVG